MRFWPGIIGALLLAAGCKSRSSPADAAGGNGDGAAGAARSDSVAAYESTSNGALQVMSVSNPVHWFEVYRDSTRVLSGNPPLLNSTVELAPGDYAVDVNRTRRPVTIVAGRKTILWTGELVVAGGGTSDFWYPVQNGERRVISNPPLVGAPVPLFPGSYTALVQGSVTMPMDTLGPAEVTAGQTTTLRR